MDTIKSSKKAKRTFNPIRHIVDNLKPALDHPLPLLNLALGDPTAFGNLSCPSVMNDALNDIISRGSGNGYLPSTGSNAAKASIAKYTTKAFDITPINDDDVVICSGCSGSVEMAISVLLDEGDNLLCPKPGFPLYEVITNSIGAEVKHYNLLSNRNWECDLTHLESLIDDKTKAILINNPSNPCGSNFTKEHLIEIVQVAKKYKLPIIADEIYGGCVFDGQFIPICKVAEDVPVLSLGGLAKQFVVPGWRCGWITIHDDQCRDRFHEIRNGLKSLSQIILGANSLIQSIIPRILTPVAGSNDEQTLRTFHERYMSILRSNAELCTELSTTVPEITVAVPQGAMYAMIEIDLASLQYNGNSIKDDAEFAQLLLKEQNIVLLPGQCFGSLNSVRIVTCPPREVINEAFQRIKHFIESHRKN